MPILHFAPACTRTTIFSALLFLVSSVPAQTDCLSAKRSTRAVNIKSEERDLAPVDILHQRITLDLTVAGLISGWCDIRFTPRNEAIDHIQLDLEALTVDSVTGATGQLEFMHEGNALDITLDAPIGTTDTLDITVYYGGDPVTDGSGFGGFYTGGSLIYNLGVAFESIPHSYGRVWFPCLDNFTERNTYEFLIKTAGGKKAWCNGLLIERTALGGDTLVNHWRIDETMPAYLASVAAANFVVARDTFPSVSGSDIPVELIAAAGDTTAMKSSFTHLPDAFAHFEEVFGPYRWDRVGYVLTTLGAMEHATSIHYPRSIASGSLQYEATMAHELAHHWFGDLVTCDRAEEMYINEGFAEYLSYLFLEHVHGRERYMTEVRNNHRNMVHRAHTLDEGWWTLSEMPQTWTYGEHSYNKGADVLHTLRSYLGDEAFSAGLTSFLTNYAFQPVNTTMLRDHLTQATGIDMTDYFADWIQQPGWAAFEIDEQSFTQGEDGWSTSLSIGQKLRGPATLYHNVPVTIAVVGVDPGNIFRDTVMVGGASTFVSFTTPFEPGWVWINDDDRISLAMTGETDTITTTGTVASDIANFELMPEAGDPVVVRMEQYWVPPDEGTYIEPFAYVISPDRYWRITGNWTDAHRFQARVTFDGRTSGNDLLDTGLMHDTLGVEFHEDSLVLLHRSGPERPWEEWASDVLSFGSPTDGYGWMNIDSLRTGEYAFAWRKSPVGIAETGGASINWSVQPNPAQDLVTISTANAGLRGMIILMDGLGQEVRRVPCTGSPVQIPLDGAANGSYNLQFTDARGNSSHVGQVVIAR
ncbi:MAG TPA: M1 family metallopeptidase [Flavobacteriales bacterium]|nr:M1 family metallopeptidase [Flavobacteriales bacterium]